MNKIFSKCRDFGLIVHLNNINLENALNCVKSLISGNLPLCIIDIFQFKNWEVILKEIAFKADLFIAVENIKTIEDAYSAAGYGAQFFILSNADKKLMEDLKNSGFYYIPKISTSKDLENCDFLQIECCICEDPELLRQSSIKLVSKDLSKFKYDEKYLFSIIDLPSEHIDYELWINGVIKDFLGLNYTTVIMSENILDLEKEFALMFSGTNKCKLLNGRDNLILLECKDFYRTVSYLKWRNIYINPNKTISHGGRIIESTIEKKFNGFTIVLRERSKHEHKELN